MHKNIYRTNKTLINNWNEEQFDTEFDDDRANRPRLLSPTELEWKSTYASEHCLDNTTKCLSLATAPLANTPLRHRLPRDNSPLKSSAANNNNDNNGKNSPLPSSIEDENYRNQLVKSKAFPGHQPLTDPHNFNLPSNPFETTARASYKHPRSIPKPLMRDGMDPVRGIELNSPELLDQYRERWTKSSPVHRSNLVSEYGKSFRNHLSPSKDRGGSGSDNDAQAHAALQTRFNGKRRADTSN